MKLLSTLLLFGSVLVAACDGSDIDSDEEARRAYLGLDESIAKSITLGFQGFNTAQSANISPQNTTGLSAGTLTITGQVDQGASANKGMRLRVGMVGYTDGETVIDDDGNTIVITYDTDANVDLQPALTMQLKNIPTGTLEGSLRGVYRMSDDLTGTAELNLNFGGTLQDGGDGTVLRVPGSTRVTGTVVSGDGEFVVDLTI
jgi:hypothetical protein